MRPVRELVSTARAASAAAPDTVSAAARPRRSATCPRSWWPAVSPASPAPMTCRVSDVPGSSVPGVHRGSRITHMYPFGPLPGCAAMITLLSHDGTAASASTSTPRRSPTRAGSPICGRVWMRWWPWPGEPGLPARRRGLQGTASAAAHGPGSGTVLGVYTRVSPGPVNTGRADAGRAQGAEWREAGRDGSPPGRGGLAPRSRRAGGGRARGAAGGADGADARAGEGAAGRAGWPTPRW